LPRVGLSPTRVVDAAGSLADEVGLDQLTLSALADRLGVRQPSLYKHVAGLDAVRGALAVQARYELAGVLTKATAGLTRGEALRALAAAYREWALARPGMYAAAQAAPNRDDPESVRASDAAVNAVFDALRGYHLDEDALIDSVRTLRAVVHGYVALEQAGAFGLDRPVADSIEWALSFLDAAMQDPTSTVP
jgi:AcrR family transcriptional regulator